MSNSKKHTTYDTLTMAILKLVFDMASRSDQHLPDTTRMLRNMHPFELLVSDNSRNKQITISSVSQICSLFNIQTDSVVARVELLAKALRARDWVVAYEESEPDVAASWFSFFETSDLKQHMLSVAQLYPTDRIPRLLSEIVKDFVLILTERALSSEVTVRWQKKFESEHAAQKARLESATTHLKK